MKINILLLVLLSATCFSSFAQEDSLCVYVHGTLLDYVTHESIPDTNGVTVSLLDCDSIELLKTQSVIFPKLPHNYSHFSLKIDTPGEYILKFENSHYQDLFEPVNLKFDKETKEIDLGDFLLKRNRLKVLDEVECTATLLKFYFNKDTLVYNTNLFMTQHGFVLEEILKKMPGVVIRDNGEIEINGRKVDAMLLNGKDFFNRDRNTLLQNLPAFMIKDVQVYDKTKDSTSLIKREREFQGYVMNVKLKKEYAIAQLGNLDLAYGTDERYYAKIFGMRFSQIARLSAYIVSNDINKNEWLSSDGRSREQQSGDGYINRIRGGFSYNYDQPRGYCSLDGNAVIEYSDQYLENAIASHDLYVGEDVFSRKMNNINYYKFSVQTSHRLNLLENTAWDITISPHLSYKRNNGNGTLKSASMNHDMDVLWGKSWRDSLMSVEQSKAMALYGITQTESTGEFNKSALQTSIGVSKDIHFSSRQILALAVSYSYNKLSSNSYDQNGIVQVKKKSDNWLNKYKNQVSEDNLRNAGITYILHYGDNEVQVGYNYNTKSFKNENSLYALHELAGWNGRNQLGLLPSQELLLNVLDIQNSYSYTQCDLKQALTLKYSYSLGDDNSQSNVSVEIPWILEQNKLEFHQQLTDTTIKRGKYTPNIMLNFGKKISYQNHSSLNYGVNYSFRSIMPTLFNMVNFTDNNDPLYISKGNPELEDTRIHSVSSNISYQNTRGYIERLHSIFSSYKNEVGHSIMHNSESGVMESKPMNINGNWTLSIDAFNTLYVTGNRQSSVSNEMKISWRNNADYISSTNYVIDGKQEVLTTEIDEKINFSWTSKNTKVQAGGTAYINYTFSTSKRVDFSAKEVLNYGFQGLVRYELPYDLLFQTDILSVCRKGYNAADMNDKEYIWNANLNKKFGERYSLGLECYDILNQRKSFYNYINAQGSYSHFCNNMHRYLMLHFTMRVSKGGQRYNSLRQHHTH